MTNVFADIEASDAEHKRILAGLQVTNKDAQKFVVLLIQTLRILAPELALVHWRPLQSTRLHFSGILIERAEILHGRLQFLSEELHIGGDILVIVLALLENRQLLQHLALHHGNAVLLGHLRVLRLLDEVAVHGENNTRNLLLDRIAEDISEDNNHIEFVHLLGEQRVEGEHPDAEDELVLHLEVDASSEHREQRRDAINGDEREAVLVNAQHHLKTTRHRLDVLIVLKHTITD